MLVQTNSTVQRYYSMMNKLPDIESVLPLTSRRVKQMNFMSEETRMLKRKLKK